MRRRGGELALARGDLCEKAIRGFDRLRTEILCPIEEVMLVHPMLGEIPHLRALRTIQVERLDAWRGTSCFDPVAWVWDRNQL